MQISPKPFDVRTELQGHNYISIELIHLWLVTNIYIKFCS